MTLGNGQLARDRMRMGVVGSYGQMTGITGAQSRARRAGEVGSGQSGARMRDGRGGCYAVATGGWRDRWCVVPCTMMLLRGGGNPMRATMVRLARRDADGRREVLRSDGRDHGCVDAVDDGAGEEGVWADWYSETKTSDIAGQATLLGMTVVKTTTADGDHGVERSEDFDDAIFGGGWWGGGGEGTIMPTTMLRTVTDSTARSGHHPLPGTYRRPRRARAAPDDHEPWRALAAAARLARGDGVAEPGLVRAAGGAGVAEGAADGLVGEVGRLGEEGRRDGDGVGGVLEDGLGAAEAGAWLCLGLGRHARALGGYRGEGMQGIVGVEEEEKSAKIASSGAWIDVPKGEFNKVTWAPQIVMSPIWASWGPFLFSLPGSTPLHSSRRPDACWCSTSSSPSSPPSID
ncbi:hypothetical protein HWV62_37787 [Athelia sp. TMB]|nr:hypothetical protein HWV62_37787 [Athelia sp. TMB]